MNKVRRVPADQQAAAPAASQETQDALAESCRQMATDVERELEAEEWAEELIHDAG